MLLYKYLKLDNDPPFMCLPNPVCKTSEEKAFFVVREWIQVIIVQLIVYHSACVAFVLSNNELGLSLQFWTTTASYDDFLNKNILLLKILILCILYWKTYIYQTKFNFYTQDRCFMNMWLVLRKKLFFIWNRSFVFVSKAIT